MTIEQKIAKELFGTTDYQAVLKVLSPSCEIVRKFKRKVDEQKGVNHE